MTQKIYRRPDMSSCVIFHGMVTASNRMKEVFRLIERVARSESAVLVRGDSGTGKELVAQAIHALSPRQSYPFHAINCAVLAPELMASELFGHARGAFTGAVAEHKGLFNASHLGSLFLDEIAELPLSVQARLLRVLQEKSFFPVGSTKQVSVDVRMIAATHKALRTEVQEGRFREDLMYRIRVVPIFLPKLSQRDGDVNYLAWRFIDEFNQHGFRKVEQIAEDAYDALMSYSWPGNIRELRNNIEHAFAIGEGPTISLSELPPELRGQEPLQKEANEQTLKEKERSRIVFALEKASGKRSVAAAILGMSRGTLWRKLKEHGLV